MSACARVLAVRVYVYTCKCECVHRHVCVCLHVRVCVFACACLQFLVSKELLHLRALACIVNCEHACENCLKTSGMERCRFLLLG